MQETRHADALKEPFAGLFTQGMVVHETYRAPNGGWLSPAEIRVESGAGGRVAPSRLDGDEPVEIGPIEKMSKSKRNTVDPDDIIETYGADTARWFMLSDSPPDRRRDLDRGRRPRRGEIRPARCGASIGELAGRRAPARSPAPANFPPRRLDIRKVAHGPWSRPRNIIERLRFNVAVAQIYDLANMLVRRRRRARNPEI